MTPVRMLRLVTVSVVLAVTSACGGDPDVTADASAVLQERVAEIRTLAEARQAEAVIAKVYELSALVEQLRSDGEISDDAAEEILASVTAVREHVATITTTTTTTAPPPPEDDDKDDDDKDEEDKKDDDEGGGNGNEGRGNGNDDD